MIDLDQLYKDGEKAGIIKDQLDRIRYETSHNQNLQRNLIDVDESISEIEKSIEVAIKEGSTTESLEIVKACLMDIKSEIISRISTIK
jgi:hypothetical protein